MSFRQSFLVQLANQWQNRYHMTFIWIQFNVRLERPTCRCNWTIWWVKIKILHATCTVKTSNNQRLTCVFQCNLIKTWLLLDVLMLKLSSKVFLVSADKRYEIPGRMSLTPLSADKKYQCFLNWRLQIPCRLRWIFMIESVCLQTL